MSFASIEAMLDAAEENNCSLQEAICLSDCAESGISEEASREQMHYLWQVMKKTSADYKASDRSNSGLIGGEAQKLHDAAEKGILLGDQYFTDVIEEALKTAECNACMKRIVAAPTAGSCGVIPAVLLPYAKKYKLPDETMENALYVAAGIGQVIAARASLAGAEGGCQAEVGAASAMAAAALTYLMGGSPKQSANAVAIALGNLLGLVCDPVAGLVEVPCVKRNVIGATNAISSANMAIAGLTSCIPADEVIDAMGEVGDLMNSDLRETGIGGLAGTPTAKKITRELRNKATERVQGDAS
jgi:L-serine dehydratase